MIMNKQIKKIINQLPYIKDLYYNSQKYLEYKRNSCFESGEYYSPIVSIDSINKREYEVWNHTGKDGISGIDLNTTKQIELINNIKKFYNEIPFKPEKQPNIRYFYENPFYSYTDGIILYSIIRYLKPKRIIEIGSGFSSAVMLDTNELFFENQINLTFIEPYPERLFSILKNNDKTSSTIIESEVQEISLDVFKKLQPGDILFVDSSHVVKTGSDVNYILFEILPVLQSGVFIHFHDVFYPFEYPKKWVYEGRNWNEDYFLKAFLMYNRNFEIRLFSDYIHRHYKDAFKSMPLTYNNFGGNIWLEKKSF
jgi:predicted O-methyltransferase YrrM